MFDFPPVTAPSATPGSASPRLTIPPLDALGALPTAAPSPIPCEEVCGDSFALAEGELTAGRAAALRAHANRCAGCHASLDRDAEFVRFVRRHVPRAAASPELRDRVRQTLGAQPGGSSRPPARRRAP